MVEVVLEAVLGRLLGALGNHLIAAAANDYPDAEEGQADQQAGEPDVPLLSLGQPKAAISPSFSQVREVRVLHRESLYLGDDLFDMLRTQENKSCFFDGAALSTRAACKINKAKIRNKFEGPSRKCRNFVSN